MLHADLHAAGFLLDTEYVGTAQHTNEEVMIGFYKSESSESVSKCLTCNQKPTGSQFSLLYEPN